jgi:hypothetical protein
MQWTPKLCLKRKIIERNPPFAFLQLSNNLLLTMDDRKNDTELWEQEEEFVYLQKAVWQFHDKFRDKNGDSDSEANVTKLPTTDSLTCLRNYTDELFPAICSYLNKCRAKPSSCNLNVTSILSETTRPPETLGSDSSTSTPGKNGSNLFRAPGAGRSRGLTLMTDTLRCDDVPTDSFKGLRVRVFMFFVFAEKHTVIFSNWFVIVIESFTFMTNNLLLEGVCPWS